MPIPCFFFFNDTAPTEIYTLSLHDRSSDLSRDELRIRSAGTGGTDRVTERRPRERSEEHTSELQSLTNIVCRLLLEKKNLDVEACRCGRTTARMARIKGRTDDMLVIKAGHL